MQKGATAICSQPLPYKIWEVSHQAAHADRLFQKEKHYQIVVIPLPFSVFNEWDANVQVEVASSDWSVCKQTSPPFLECCH